jgi:cytoskeleton protein RodZ
MSQSVGEQLRVAREARGWSVEDVASRLKISAKYVLALEAGDTAALPEPTFVRGYIKSYAKALGLDADALLAVSAPVEVKAPRPLIGPEGQATSSRRSGAPVRAPSFKSGSSWRLRLFVGVAVIAAAVWAVWQSGNSIEATTVAVPVVPAVVQAAPVPAVPATQGGVTLEVPLPGAAVPAAPAAAATLPAPAPLTSVNTAVALPVPPSLAKPAQVSVPAVAAPAVEAAPVPAAPRKGLHARFSGTCWVEVRDADNVVIHTRIAMAGNEINVDGKAPLTVTLGDASAAELWFNGDRVAADKFSSSGIARIIVGQTPR